jgi:predicted small secreted protein
MEQATEILSRSDISLTHSTMKKYINISTLTAALLALGCLWLTSCNTIAGAGRDVQNTGAAVSRAAN